MIKLVSFNRWLAFAHDIFWIPASLFMAFWFRFNLSKIPPDYLRGFLYLTLIALPVHAAFFWFFGLYRGVWRFASMPDLVRIVKSVTLGSLALTMSGVVLFKLEGVPRSVLIFSPLLLVIGLIGGRICYRIIKDKRLQLRSKEGVRTLIVGAGQAGDLLLRDLLTRQEYQPVAFVDDDKTKHGGEIHGVRVWGALTDITELIDKFKIELVLFAIPSIHKKTVPQLIEKCCSANVEFKTLPSIHEKNSDKVNAGQLRSLTLEDLLGRDTIFLDTRAIESYIRGKVVLVTGGGGSIGSELCRQILDNKPGRLIVFDNGEFNLYSIDNELSQHDSETLLTVVLGDVKNKARLEWVFNKFSPEVVFHAAAYKHVPMLELNPAEGVQNNVEGTKVLADVAAQFNVEKFVLVSTDKAVNPANVMGTTKRIAELYCQNLNKRCSTSFVTTRFGNVLGSAGSVVPLFQKQIETGGPVTVTHPDIKRYFMTIPESVGLILQAGAMGEGGEIFVLDMGEPILIKDMAENMIRLSGLEPGIDIKLIYTGLRPGEKLYEELLHESEGLLETDHSKLFLARCRDVEWDWLERELNSLCEAASSRKLTLIREHLHNIVPEYSVQ